MLAEAYILLQRPATYNNPMNAWLTEGFVQGNQQANLLHLYWACVKGQAHSMLLCRIPHSHSLGRILQGLNQGEWNERTEISMLVNNLHVARECSLFSGDFQAKQCDCCYGGRRVLILFSVIISYPEALAGDSPQPQPWKVSLVSAVSKQIIACISGLPEAC